MHYDNIEIGTSDFRTLIESANGNGISVEPVKPYFDRLPDREGWGKVNVAISDKAYYSIVYYVDPDNITDEPDWVRGCNSLNVPHPTIRKMFPHLENTAYVQCITMQMLFNMFDVTSVDLLKIDTEGHDLVIINSYLDYELPLAKRIEFESNELIDETEYNKTIKRLSNLGYKTRKLKLNTICWL